jgi:hypothetical protein
LFIALILAFAASRAATSQHSRSFGGRNVARSTGRISRARQDGGHTGSSTSKCASCERDASGRIKRESGGPTGTGLVITSTGRESDTARVYAAQ